ncbi:hypothetical protein ABPG77_006042 [Micractinium sp. CCAP 211/92]
MPPLLALGACPAVLHVVGLARQTRHPSSCFSSSGPTEQRRAPVKWQITGGTDRRRIVATASNRNGSSSNGSSTSSRPSGVGSQQSSDENLPDQLAAAPPAQNQGRPGSWWPAGRWLAIGGSVAAVLVLTVFRREVAPALRWLITQVNNLTDKSLIGEAGEGKLEGILTLLAVALTLYWSFTEFAASSERAKAAVGLEARVAALEARLDDVAAELAELRSSQPGSGRAHGEGEASSQGAVDQLAAELAQLRQEQLPIYESLSQQVSAHTACRNAIPLYVVS